MQLEQQIMAACGHAMGGADPTMESPDPGPAFLQKQASGVFAFVAALSYAAIPLLCKERRGMIETDVETKKGDIRNQARLRNGLSVKRRTNVAA